MKKTTDIINHQHTSSGLTSFGANIEDLTKKLLGKNGFLYADILQNWSQIVGEDLASHSFPERIDFSKDMRTNGTLYLQVSSGAFAVEIEHKKPLILEKINTYFGYQAVNQIKIVQNADGFDKKANINIADIEKKKLVSIDEQNYIEAISEGIEDEVLKARLQSLAFSVLSAQKKES